MKTKDELNTLKAEVKAMSSKRAELNDDELNQVTGGFDSDYDIIWKKAGDEVENPIDVGDYTATITSR